MKRVKEATTKIIQVVTASVLYWTQRFTICPQNSTNYFYKIYLILYSHLHIDFSGEVTEGHKIKFEHKFIFTNLFLLHVWFI